MKKWLLMGAVLWLLFSFVFSEDEHGKVESNFTPQIMNSIKSKLRPELVKAQKEIRAADRNIAQALDTHEDDYSSESYEKNRLKQILCFYRKNNIPFTDTPDSLYWANTLFLVKENSDEESQNYQLFVKSTDCQPPYYSRIDLEDDRGTVLIRKNIDCNRTTKEELFLTGNMQQTISFVGDENPNVKNLAISGEGYFLLACQQNGAWTSYLTRKGNFEWDSYGRLSASDNKNCTLIGGLADGSVGAVTRENIDRFRVLDIRASDIQNPHLIAKGKLQVDFPHRPIFFPRESTTEQDASSVFENYIEGVEDPNTDELGLSKDMWQKEDLSISCEDADKYFRRIENNDVSE